MPEEGAGGKTSGLFVGWAHPGGVELLICFDSNTAPNGLADWVPPDVVVEYLLFNNSLVCINQATGDEYVAAQNVSGLDVQDLGGELQITLTFAYRGVFQTYTLLAKTP